jgi:hypothetical protein
VVAEPCMMQPSGDQRMRAAPKGISPMICQVCLSTEATMHVTEQHPAGRFLGGHYCRCCWEAKECGPSSAPTCWPRPKLAIKRILIVVIGFALADCLAVLVVRNRPIEQSPDERMRSTGSAVVMVNFCISVLLLHSFMSNWLRRLTWHKRTGSARTMPSAKAMSCNRDFAWFSLSWMMVSNILTNSLGIALAASYHFRLGLFAVISAVVGTGYVWIACKSPLFERFRQIWATASEPERALALVAILWPLGVTLLFRCKLVPINVLSNINPWFWIPTLLGFVFGCHVLFLAAEALATRRRS